ncbi:efflux transporter outer membrane subunit [Ferrovibrio sp.]|uniref:efflux transporter outer membrane subunit n=1 Tax=Ferrovibrio sp. TaxID=1917215 RepID=UPI0035120DAA
MRSPLRLLPAAAVLALLPACSLIDLGPVFGKPEIAAPAAWDSRADARNLWPDTAWWTGFGSPELGALIAEAADGNADLRIAWARIRQAQASAKIAGADLYPSLSGGGDAGRNWTGTGRSNPSGAASSRGTRTVSNSFGADLSASYQVDLFGANAAGADAALASLEASQYSREAVAITLQADVAATYFGLLSLRDRIRLSEDTLRAAEDTLGLLTRQREAGASTDYEVAQQRSAVASQRATVAALQQSERESLDALAVLLGRNPQGFRIATRSLDDLRLPPVAAGLPSELLLRRPDLRKAEADLRSANYDVRAARAARFPSLSLSASAGTAGVVASNLFTPPSMAYAIAASLTAPIFQGGRLEGQEELSQARREEMVETYRAAILSAFADTETALSATVTAARRHDYAVEAYAQAQEAYRIVGARFRAGTVTFLTLLDAQRSVFAANDTLVQATLARYTAMVDLYEALGGGWDGSVQMPAAR